MLCKLGFYLLALQLGGDFLDFFELKIAPNF